MDADQVRDLLRAKTEEAGSSGTWARLNMIAPGYVADVLAKRRDPGGKILRALGLEKIVTFRESAQSLR